MEKKLNALLSNLVVEAHKVQSYHWLVKGPDFFPTHAQLEEYYDQLNEFVDSVAETMLMCEMKPVSTMKDYLAAATLSESQGDFISSKQAFADIAADFEKLRDATAEVKEDADEHGLDLVSLKADELLEFFGKGVWMLKQH